MITYLTREELQSKLHLSHLFQYVSAYEYSSEYLKLLSDQIETALEEAKRTTTTQIVNQDGECCFHVTPMGYIILMLPWRTYKVRQEK